MSPRVVILVAVSKTELSVSGALPGGPPLLTGEHAKDSGCSELRVSLLGLNDDKEGENELEGANLTQWPVRDETHNAGEASVFLKATFNPKLRDPVLPLDTVSESGACPNQVEAKKTVEGWSSL